MAHSAGTRMREVGFGQATPLGEGACAALAPVT